MYDIGALKGVELSQELKTVMVEPDAFEVADEPRLLIADLTGALAVCLHDEGRRIGGLLHLRFTGPAGRPTDLTDEALSAVLGVLDEFKTAVLGDLTRVDEIQARILAQAPPRTHEPEPKASLVDLICADFTDGKIACGTQTLRRLEPVRVCFQPFAGRIWISGPGDLRAAQKPPKPHAAAG
jgi:hypothetical protein